MLRRRIALCATLTSGLAFTAPVLAGEPYLVKDINPNGTSFPIGLTAVNGRVFFNADDGIHGQELWVSDGTEEGTYMVKEIVPGDDGSEPQNLANVNEVLFFQADNNEDGLDLWISDGTPQGTLRVADVNPGADPSPPGQCLFYLIDIEPVNDVLYFVGSDPDYGGELFKSDGTPEGTVLVRDICPGSDSGAPHQLTNVEGTLFFRAQGIHVQFPDPGELWKSDGTDEGTVMLKEASPLWITPVNGTVFFEGEDSVVGRELWISDGTPEGTKLLKDIYPGSGSSNPIWLTSFNGMLFFSAFEPNTERELWVSDGTEKGTVMLVDLDPEGSSTPGGFTSVNGTLFFTAADQINGIGLWKTDGSAEGTVLVKDIVPDGFGTPLRKFISANGMLYFVADDGIHGKELWRSDGTEAGTLMVADIREGPAPGAPRELTFVNGVLFFVSGDDITGAELWALDTREDPIPAVSDWGMVVLGLVVVCAGSILLGRQRTRTDSGAVS